MAETKESPAGSGDSATATSCLSASGSTSALGMYSSTCSTQAWCSLGVRTQQAALLERKVGLMCLVGPVPITLRRLCMHTKIVILPSALSSLLLEVIDKTQVGHWSAKAKATIAGFSNKDRPALGSKAKVQVHNTAQLRDVNSTVPGS